VPNTCLHLTPLRGAGEAQAVRRPSPSPSPRLPKDNYLRENRPPQPGRWRVRRRWPSWPGSGPWPPAGGAGELSLQPTPRLEADGQGGVPEGPWPSAPGPPGAAELHPLARLHQRAAEGGAYEQSGMAIDWYPAKPFIHHSNPIGFCIIWNPRFILLWSFGPRAADPGRWSLASDLPARSHGARGDHGYSRPSQIPD